MGNSVFFLFFMADYEGGLEASKTRRRKPVERLSESPIFPRKQKRDSSLSPSGKGRKRALEDPIENLDTKRVKYSHNYDDEEEEELQKLFLQLELHQVIIVLQILF